LGQNTVAELVGDIDVGLIEASLHPSNGAVFAEGLHTVVPPSFAPVRWVADIERFLEDFPFDQNVFLMTRFPRDAQDESYLDPIRELIEVGRSLLSDHGLTLHLASDRNIVDDLFSNIAAHMWSSRYGIGLLENRLNQGLNYNVMTELGAMLVTGRRCALLKDRTVKNLPTDLSGHIYKSVDFDDKDAFVSELSDWVINDLGL
jgi:hypothetical protein